MALTCFEQAHAWDSYSWPDPPSSRQTWGAYLRMDRQALSNGMPVLDMDGDWRHGYRARAGSQRAYQTASAEIGVMWGGRVAAVPLRLAVGAVVRADAFAKASGEAAAVVQHYQSRTDPAEASRYDAGTHVRAWVGHGLSLRLSPAAVGPLRFDLQWQWLNLTRWRDVATAGEAVFDGHDRYDFAVDIRHDRSGFQPPYSAPPEHNGQGMSLSLGASWRLDEAFGLSLRVDDLWSRLNWHGLNGDDAVADSEVATRTPDGYLAYEPIVQGRYSRKSVRGTIPPALHIDAEWRRAEIGALFVGLHRRVGLQQTWLGWRGEGAWQWSAAIEPRLKAWQFGLARGGWRAQWEFDRWDEAAHLARWSLSYTWWR